MHGQKFLSKIRKILSFNLQVKIPILIDRYSFHEQQKNTPFHMLFELSPVITGVQIKYIWKQKIQYFLNKYSMLMVEIQKYKNQRVFNCMCCTFSVYLHASFNGRHTVRLFCPSVYTGHIKGLGYLMGQCMQLTLFTSVGFPPYHTSLWRLRDGI